MNNNINLKKNKRIIFVIKDLNTVGGAENVLKNITKSLSEKSKYEIFIISLNQARLSNLEESKNLKIITINKNKFFKYFRKGEMFFYVFLIEKLIRKIKPELVIGWMSSAYIPLSFLALFSNYKFLASEHTTYRRYQYRIIENILFLFTSFFIKKYAVCNLSAKNTFPNFISSKMEIVRNPELVNNSKINRSAELPKKVKKFISVGRLVKSKDHTTSIKAFSKVAKKYPDVIFEIWGEGPEKKRIFYLIKKLGLENRIFLKGISFDHSKIYSMGSIMISSTRYESDGLSVRESTGYGVPVLCFDDVPSLKVHVSHFYNGIISSNSDRINNLAKSMKIILKNPKIFQAINNQPVLHVRIQKNSVSWEEFINSQ